MHAVRAHLPIPRLRRGRVLVGAAVLVLALGGAAAGVILSLNSAGGRSRGLDEASFPGFHLSFDYPSAWGRQDWCWLGTAVFPLTLLTTAHPVPACKQNTQYGEGTALPPPQRLGRNGVSTWWFASGRRGPTVLKPNARLGGQPARITVRREPTRRTSSSYVNCTTGTTQRFLTARIQDKSSSVREIQVGAVICGPQFAAGEAAVRRMLASLRFTD